MSELLPFSSDADPAAIAATLSALLHILGYALYIRLSLLDDVEPNPLTWLMFAYGTTLLTVIEYESGASWRELALPVACSCGAVIVATICSFRGRLRLPRSRLETGAFLGDILLTVAYAAFWLGSRRAEISSEKAFFEFGFLLASNATTVTAFIPILVSTRLHPEGERAAPWIVWTSAYAMLFVATLPSMGGYEKASLLIYPLSNFVLHAMVALLALTGRWATRELAVLDLRVGPTPRTGLGLFARRPFARGELVFRMTGKQRTFEIRTPEQSAHFEKWLGVGKNRHLLPDRPYIFANHSCEPNLGIRGTRDFIALRDIDEGEELTFDYSTTSDEFTWSMPCRCGHPECRHIIQGIQSLPPRVFERYLPFINPYFAAVYRQYRARHGDQVIHASATRDPLRAMQGRGASARESRDPDPLQG